MKTTRDTTPSATVFKRAIHSSTAAILLFGCVAANRAREEVSTPPPLQAETRNNIRNILLTSPELQTGMSLSPDVERDFRKVLRRREAVGRATITHDELILCRSDFRDAQTVLSAPFVAIAYVSGLAHTPSNAELEEYGRFVDKDREAVAEALTAAAAQEIFAEAFLKAGNKQATRRFQIQRATGEHSVHPFVPDVVIENTVETVRLERKAKKNAYALAVEVRTRLMGAGKDRVVYDEVTRYRSDPAEFSDWAFNHGEPLKEQFQRACEQISTRLAAQVLPKGIAADMERSKDRRANVSAGLVIVRSMPIQPEDLGKLRRVGVITTCAVPNITVQAPLTKEKAAAELRARTEDMLDYIPPCDPILGTAASMAAVAPGLAAQSTAVARGLTEAQFSRSDRAITKAAFESKVQPLLRSHFLAHATNATSHPIIEVPKPFPAGREAEWSQFGCVMAGTLAWLPKGQTAEYYLESQNVQSVMELEIIDPALKGRGEINPGMAFSARVRATLWQVQGGQEIASCEMLYTSPRQKFAVWANNDGELFRREMDSFGEAVSAALVQQFGIPAWPVEAQPQLASTAR